jgi:hypothetical protein
MSTPAKEIVITAVRYDAGGFFLDLRTGPILRQLGYYLTHDLAIENAHRFAAWLNAVVIDESCDLGVTRATAV